MAEIKVPQLTLCLIVACFQLASTTDADLTRRMDTLEAEYNIMKARYSEISAENTIIKARYTEMTAENNSMKTRYTVMEARYTAMEARYTAMEARYIAMGARYTTLGARYTTMEARYTTMEARYTTMEAMYRELSAKIVHSETREPAPTATGIQAGPLDNPIMDIDVKKVNPQLSGLWCVAATPDGVAVLCDNNVDNQICQAVRLNTTGFADPTPIYTSDTPIRAIIPIDDQEVIIAGWQGDIKRVNQENHTVLASYQVDVHFLFDAILLEDYVLLYVDAKRGQAVTYSMSDNSTVVRISSLYFPTGIARYTNSTHTLYFVNEYRTHHISVYDFSWNLVNTIGGLGTEAGQLNRTFDVMLSPKDTIWVADFGNNRVEEFSLEGKFVRHVISGIKQPWRLSYHPLHPAYLWVAYFEGNSSTVSRFQIY